jgi:hypothetical protein
MSHWGCGFRASADALPTPIVSQEAVKSHDILYKMRKDGPPASLNALYVASHHQGARLAQRKDHDFSLANRP